MAKFILGEKRAMTQKFSDDGTVIPVTAVVAGPCVITQIKTAKRDGYTAIQVGFGSMKKKNLTKPMAGHLQGRGPFKVLSEFRVEPAQADGLKVGDVITTTTFNVGDVIKVTGQSKGKGFQGVVRRHGFHGSPKTHGHKDQLRMPGSIGSTGPQHVFKGTRMGGHMGDEQVTITNLQVVAINPDTNEMYIKGAVPGARGGVISISGVGVLETTVASSVSSEPVKTEPVVEGQQVPVEAVVDQPTPEPEAGTPVETPQNEESKAE